MPKVVNDLNQIWVEQSKDWVKIGFTRDFLDELAECWHILPANNRRFRKQMPLMTIETNDGLVSVLSPVDGNLVQFNRKAQDFPNKLTDEDVIFELTSKEVVQPKRTQPRAAGFAEALRGAQLGEAVLERQRAGADWIIQANMAAQAIPVPPEPIDFEEF